VDNSSHRFLTVKSAVVAFGCIIGSSIAGCYSAFLRYDLIGTGHLPRAALWPVMVLLAVNGVARWVRPPVLRFFGRSRTPEELKRGWFSRAELMFIYSMILVTCSIPGQQFATYWYLSLVSPIYYATPQNRFQEFFFQYLKPWLFPSMDPDAPVVRWCFESLPEGRSMPWQQWVGPTLLWTPFILAVFFLTVVLAAVVRKQWVEREQLLFPLAQIPLEMTEVVPAGEQEVPLWRNWLMWVFFLLPVWVYTQKALHFYYPKVRDINLYPTTENLFSTRPWYRLNWMPLNWYFDMIGITYLLTTEMGFSLWFFYALQRLLMVGRTWMGLQRDNEFFQHNAIGGFIVLALFYLWVMRAHLWAIVKAGLTWTRSADDAEEPLSHRGMFWGGLLSLAVLLLWCQAIGMNLAGSLFLFGAYFGGILILTRMVSESGLFVFWLPISPQEFVINSLTSTRLGARNVTTLCMVGWQIQDSASNIWPNALQGQKIAQTIGLSQRKLFWWMCLGITVAVFACHWPALNVMYKTGVPHMGWWPKGAARSLPNSIVGFLVRPNSFESDEIGWMFQGGLTTVFLVWMRQRFLWWPFHPLGFVGTFFGGVGGRYGYSIFLGWIARMAVVWIGGMRAWRKCRPVAIGMILGNCFVLFTWLLIQNFFFPISGVLVIE